MIGFLNFFFDYNHSQTTQNELKLALTLEYIGFIIFIFFVNYLCTDDNF